MYGGAHAASKVLPRGGTLRQHIFAAVKVHPDAQEDGAPYSPVYPAFTGSLLPSSWRR
jgi:hypothetical protein